LVTLAVARRNRRWDNLFFSGVAALILVAVFVGFAQSYYLAGMMRARLPNLLIHVHGAVFSAWIVLLIVQTSLVAAGRVDIHRRLGLLGFGIACLMLLLGLMAATDELIRHSKSGAADSDARAFFGILIGGMAAFASLIYFGFRERFNPAAHKRLMLIATIAILDAAFIRWPVPWRSLHRAELCSYIFLLLLAAYDLWSTGRIHRATLWGSLLLVVVEQVRSPLARTDLWQSFAGWVQHLARSVG
jgi:hypothetical protein